MTDSEWPPPRQDDHDVLKHSRSLEQIDTSEPMIMGPYVPGGADLPSQVDAEPPKPEPGPSQPEPAAPSGDE